VPIVVGVAAAIVVGVAATIVVGVAAAIVVGVAATIVVGVAATNLGGLDFASGDRAETQRELVEASACTSRLADARDPG
jgi:hypothetical protein